jgi:hypothetical protein
MNPRLPAPSLKLPLKDVLVLSPPAVNVARLEALLVIVPVPDSEPIVLLNPFRSRTDVTLNVEFGLSAVADPACSVPDATLVAPL